MGPGWWLFWFCLEAAWLAVLWLAIPESRLGSASAPPPGRRSRLAQTLLCVYVAWHLPALLFAGLFRVVDWYRVKPAGFLVLGAMSGVLNSLAKGR